MRSNNKQNKKFRFAIKEMQEIPYHQSYSYALKKIKIFIEKKGR